MSQPSARDKLINETRYFLSRGYSREFIISTLEKKGYPHDYVGKIVDYVSSQFDHHGQTYTTGKNIVQISHTHSVSKGLLVFALAFLVVFFVFFFSFFWERDQSVLLDYQVELLSTELSSGEDLSFETFYSNQGDKKSQDVFVLYRVIDQGQNIALEWSETKAIEHVTRDVVTKELPTSLAAGRYYIYSEVSYGEDQIASSRTLFFEIKEVGETDVVVDVESEDTTIIVVPEIPSSEEDSDPTNNEPLQEPETLVPTLNEEHDSILATITKAEDLATSDTTKAANLCISLEERALIDGCYQQLAKTSTNYAYCAEISDFTTKDYCYLQYIIETKDFEKCSLVSSEKTKTTCLQLNS